MKQNEKSEPVAAAPAPLAGQDKIEQEAALLVHYFQLLGARSGMLLNPNQQTDLAQIAQLILEASVQRVEAKLLGPAFDEMIDDAIDARLAAAAAKKGGTK